MSAASGALANEKTQDALQALLEQVRACRLCEADLPLGPNPVLRAGASATILIAGQAPGTRVHATGIPWNDPSGQRLRGWMDISPDLFYDDAQIAIIPMGYCYPGRDRRGGDLPPRKECAQQWLPQLLALLPRIQLTLLFGQYAQRYYLGPNAKKNLTETVRAWRDYQPRFLPMPHPSWRNIGWLKRNPWFEADVIPHLRERTHALLQR